MIVTIVWPVVLHWVIHLVEIALIVMLMIHVGRLAKFRDGLIAHARQAPVTPTPLLIAGWRRKYDLLTPGTSKHGLYRDRLIEVGALDADGNDIVPVSTEKEPPSVGKDAPDGD